MSLHLRSPRVAAHALALAGALLLVVLALPGLAHADRNPSVRFSVNDTGQIRFASNTLETCPSSSSKCASARQGIASSIDDLNDNAYTMSYVDVDSDSNTFNSSKAKLTIPSGATVLFAGLYWAGDWSTAGDWSGHGSNGPPAVNDRNKAKFKAPGASGYTTVTASQVDESTLNVGRYAAFADVTTTVRAAGTGDYWVADVQAGRDNDHYAGWTLVVAYRDTTQPARNLTIFDGLRTIRPSDPPTSFTVNGFQTPPAGSVRTTLGFVTYEGDLGILGDTASLDGHQLSDAQNPATNFFNSSISDRGTRVSDKDPDYVNQFGYEADQFDADGLLTNGATSATIRVTTSGDQYLPGVVWFATELFAPRIEQTKTVTDVNGGQVEPGDVLEYKVSGTNNGQDAAVNFTLRDPIPAGTTYVANSIKVVGGAGGPTGTMTDAVDSDQGTLESGPKVVARVGTGATGTAGGRIAAGASYDVRFRVRVDDPTAAGTTIANTATASYNSEALNTPLTTESSVSTAVKTPDLTITKTRVGNAVPGTDATYQLAVRNVGDVPSHGTVTVTDDLPTTLAPVSASGTGWACSVLGQQVICTRSDALAVGASWPIITLVAHVAADAGGTINNTAVVSGGADGNPANNSSTDPAVPQPSVDLGVQKVADHASVPVGDIVSYTLTVHNYGPSKATGVTVSDPLPTGLQYVSATPSQGTCSGTVTCLLGAIDSGSSATVTIHARTTTAGAGSTVRNTASVSGAQPDPVPGNNTGSADVFVGGIDLAIVKTASPASPQAGGPISWTIAVHNNGPSQATGVHVRDVLPAQLSGTQTVTVLEGSATCTIAGGELNCDLGTLPAGADVRLRIDGTLRADAGGVRVSNTASVSGAETDLDPSNDSSTANSDIGALADLSMEKSADKSAAGAGDQVTYTLTATNHGPSTATGVKLHDTLPAGVTFVSADSGCTQASGTVTCTIGSLANGAQAVKHVTVQVGGSTMGTVVNHASVDGTTPDPDHDNDDDYASVEIADGAGLSLAKSVNATSAIPGDVVTYTLTVHNSGPGTAHDVVLSDPIPAGLSYVSADHGCTHAGALVSCDLGDVAAGGTVVVKVTAQVDPVASPAPHDHHLLVEKVEQQVDLEAGETKTIELACASSDQVMTDGSARVDAVDQDTGTLVSVDVVRSHSLDAHTYEFTVRNTASGRAQAKVFGVCIAGHTTTDGGHSHALRLGGLVTASLAHAIPGSHELSVACGPGQVAIAPGYVASGGTVRLMASEPDGAGRRFTVDVSDDAADVTVSARCLYTRLDDADGHTHDLDLEERVRTVTVAAGATVSESVICGDLAKGIVASWDLPAGLLPLGNDPQPKSRVFKLMNTTDHPLQATLDLLCMGDRTGPAYAWSTVSNTATVSTSTPDGNPDDQVASSTLEITTAEHNPAPDDHSTHGAPLALHSSGGSSAARTADIAPSDSGDTLTLPAKPIGSVAHFSATGSGAPVVTVPLACASGAGCTGTVTLRVAKAGRFGGHRYRAGAKLGRGTFTVRAGGKGSARVRLPKALRRAVRSGQLRSVVVEVRTADGHVRRVKLSLRGR